MKRDEAHDEDQRDLGARMMLDAMERSLKDGGRFSDERANRFVDAQKRAEKAEAEVERLRSEVDHAIRYGNAQRAVVVKLDAKLDAEREQHEAAQLRLHDLAKDRIAAEREQREGLEKAEAEMERLRAALQGIIANGHEQVENRAGDLYCVEACAACAADAALRGEED